ncbi:hypothetical protein [Yokenella regensburgei]|uniref:hypothetical protein n=1 Tax=Yokenella regensburgei TaxID=158877 RepID=UPI0031D8B570
MSESLSRNNVKLHLSDLPVMFSEKLRGFFSRQPAFNDEVTKILDQNQKQLMVITQKLAATEKELSQLKKAINQQQSKAGG